MLKYSQSRLKWFSELDKDALAFYVLASSLFIGVMAIMILGATAGNRVGASNCTSSVLTEITKTTKTVTKKETCSIKEG